MTENNNLKEIINTAFKNCSSNIIKTALLNAITDTDNTTQMIEKTITSKGNITKDYIYADTAKLLKLLKKHDTENRLNVLTVADRLISDFTTFSFSSDRDSYEDLVIELVKTLYNTEATRFTFSNSNRVFSKIDNKCCLDVEIKLEKYVMEVVNI